jgi:hypothetical protein
MNMMVSPMSFPKVQRNVNCARTAAPRTAPIIAEV